MKPRIKLQPKSFFLLAGVVFLVGMGIVLLTYSSLGEQQQSLQTLKADLKDEKSVQKELDETKATISDLKSKLSHLEHGIPQAAYVATMLHELELFGKKNNLLILSVRPVFAEKKDKKDGDSEKKSAYEEQNIVVKGRGTYGGLLQFVDALKNFPKIVAVRSFTMVPRDTATINSGSPLLEFELALQAYAFKDSPKGQEDDGKVANRTIGVKHES